MERKSAIILGSILIAVPITYGIVTRIVRKKRIDEVIKLIDNPSTVQGTSVSALSFNVAFDPKYYKTVKKALLLTSASANAIADSIYNAKGIFDDNEDAIYNAFKSIKAKTQLSQLSDVFKNKYGKDLYNYLTSFLDEEELGKVKYYVDLMK